MVGYSFLLPALIIIVCMVAYPLLLSIYLSFTNTTVNTKGSFIGLNNFKFLLKDSVFWTAVYNSVLFTILSVALKLIIGLGIALLLFQPMFQSKWIRAAVLLPWVIPSTFSILGWLWILDPLYGSLNWVRTRMGFPKIPWLSSTFWARFSVILVNTWRGIPFFAIGLLGGLVGIPTEIFEAAEMDGAKPFKKFWSITLPLLRPPLLTRGGPLNTTQVLATLAYQYGLSGGQLGLGAAVSIFMFPILLVLAVFILRIISKEEVY